MIRPLGVPVPPIPSPTRERLAARAVTLAASYMKQPNIESLTRQAREILDADPAKTSTDVAYLLVRNGQGELEL